MDRNILAAALAFLVAPAMAIQTKIQPDQIDQYHEGWTFQDVTVSTAPGSCALRVSSATAGQVGVGTCSPQAGIHVVGQSIRVSSSTGQNVGYIFPDGTLQTTAGGGNVLLNSTNTWNSQQNFNNQVTFSSTVVIKNGNLVFSTTSGNFGIFFQDGTFQNSANTPVTQSTVVPTTFGWVEDNFTSQVNGVTTVFALSKVPTSNTGLIVVLDGLLQLQGKDYSVSMTTITMTTAPAANSYSFFALYSTGVALGGVNGIPGVLNATQTWSGQNTFTQNTFFTSLGPNQFVITNGADQLSSQATINLGSQVNGNLSTTSFNSGTLADNSHFWRGDGLWAKVDLSTAVTGNLPVGNLNSGSGANSTTFWRGDATWTQVNLSNAVTGNLPVGNLNSGSGATSSTFWRGDGTWATPSGSGGGGFTTEQVFTSNGTFTVPGGVSKIFVQAWGGGGGGNGASTGASGAATSVGSPVGITANGGTGGTGTIGAAGGSASGGTFNSTGGHGGSDGAAQGGAATQGGSGGGGAGSAANGFDGSVPGGGGGGASGGGGGAGGFAEGIYNVSGGQNISVTIGSGGSGGTNAGNGAQGLVKIWY